MIGILLAFLLCVYLITDTLIEYKELKEIKPMGKVIASQKFDVLDFKLIYKTLELQIELNKRMINLLVDDKQKITELKTVNKATKDTLKKVKAVLKEAGEKV